MAKRRIVIDFDVGTDDAIALMMFLHADQIGSIKIEALICSYGNTEREHVVENTVRLLELANRTNIPVYRGSRTSLIPLRHPINKFHGEDGFGDLDHDDQPDLSIVKPENGIVALNGLVRKFPKELTLVCTGPLTTLALAIKTFDGFAENVKELFVMGGNYTAVGNITASAEYNFYMDPEAVHVVFEKPRFPITLVTWEVCNTSTITMEWRYKVLAKIRSPFMDLMTRAERKIYKNYDLQDPYLICDAFLAAVLLRPDLVERTSEHHATVELHGYDTRGQVVLDHLKKSKTNVSVIERIDFETMKGAFIEAAMSLPL